MLEEDEPESESAVRAVLLYRARWIRTLRLCVRLKVAQAAAALAAVRMRRHQPLNLAVVSHQTMAMCMCLGMVRMCMAHCP